MSVYLQSIISGFLIFPIIAAIFTLPYVISQYRKYGAMLLIRVMVVYSLILYLICAYFMVLLPLPSEDIPRLTQTMQLVPFNTVTIMINKLSQVSSIISVFKQPIVYQTLFNILLTLPLGVYLRYYFNKKWYHVLIVGFLVSLSFELLQLTGICGIYKYPYRLFDVDDLIVNTIGAMLGFVITPVMTKYLPSKEKLEEQSYIKGNTVSFTRRLLAYLIDTIIIIVLINIIHLFIKINHYQIFIDYLLIVSIYYGLFMYINKGQTIGKRIVKLAIVSEDNQRVTYLQCIKRYGLLLLFVYILPIVIYELVRLSVIYGGLVKVILIIEALLLMIIFIIFIFRIVVVNMFGHKEIMYGEYSQTKNISKVKKDD